MKFMFFLLLFPLVALAQVDAINPEDPFISLLIESLGGLKGAGAMGISLIVVKLLIASMNSNLFGKLWDKMSSVAKFTIASLLSYLLAVFSLVSTELTLGSALVHATVVPLLLAFLHQAYTYYIERKTADQLISKAEKLIKEADKL